MFSEWTSLSPTIAANSNGAQSQSVLTKFAGPAGRDVAVAVVKQLASNLGPTQTAVPSTLVKDDEVLWCMDVVCHGLSLPLSEHETIKDCVSVYCDWLTALCAVPNVTVPRPIVEDANVYCRKIINHFHNLFVPRVGEVWPFIYQESLGPDIINRQALLCHRVLRTLHTVAQTSKLLTRESWEALLLFLLAINEILLAPPIIKDDLGEQLCERVLSVLFEVWLLACDRCFPSPSLWKTLQESCALLRHRIALIEQWNRVNLALTARLLHFSYGPVFPELRIAEGDASLLPSTMSDDCVAQTWYRMLRTIGSPIALCSPATVSKTPQFMQWAAMRANGQEPAQHPCLQMLPLIFLKAIKGVSNLVDAFLGIYVRPLRIEDQPMPHIPDAATQVPSAASSVAASVRHSVVDFRAVLHHHHPHLHHHHSLTHHGQQPHGNTSSTHGSTGAVAYTPVAGIPATNPAGGVANTSSSLITNTNEAPHSPTPPLQRRLAKSFSVAPSSAQSKGLSKGSLIGLTSSRSVVTQQAPTTPNSGPPSTSSLSSLPSIGAEARPVLTPHRPKCNSILHLFGEWLFEAAHIGGDAWLQNTKKIATEASRRPSSMVMDTRKGSLSLSQPSSLTDIVDPLFAHITIDKYESGRAEAMGALCRIFCAKKTGEEILPVYLARFYMALQQGLKIPESKTCEETMASILYNSADLFRLDLDGVLVLMPAFIAALELVLPEKELKFRVQQHSSLAFQKNELRRASIHLLLSMLALPLHFQSLPIRDLSNGPLDKLITFEQLKPRLVNILMNAVRIETDAQNTHMLLGGLLLCVQDAVYFEESGEGVASMGGDSFHQSSPGHSDANLLSSACSEKSVGSMASAGSSSIGGHSTATTSGMTVNNDYPSLGSTSDGMPSDLMAELEMIPFFDNAHALFVHATYLVCHRLISTWKADLNVSLAALELLSGLARMHIKDSDALECKRAVKWICDYIFYQCQRPPQAHSKDLHSTIVAAFQCTSAWLMQHPYLLQDKDCLTTVLEVVELGISGSKSVGKPGEPMKLKDEKELKPASMRVREAAETLLTIILEQVGYFPNECGPQSTSSLLDEVTLFKYCNSSPADADPVSHEHAIQKFRYFVTENSTIMALLEEPLGNDQDPQPTVTMLIRGPFGRNAWTMQLRHLPRSKSGTKYHAANPGRPVPMNDMPQRPEIELKHFPDGVERVLPCAADFSIPTLEEIIEKTGTDHTKRLIDLIERQTVFEKLAWAETESSEDSLGHAQESQAPNVCHEFQAARLFLSHFGFLSIGGADETNETTRKSDQTDALPMPSNSTPLLTVLDTKKPGFSAELQLLDKLSPRTNDTVHIFYVKAGQTTGQEIIENMNEENLTSLDPNFWTILQGLGNPVNVAEHAGWTGFVNNSWHIKVAQKSARSDSEHSRKFNGERRILYWADVGSEIAFVVPTNWNLCDDSFNEGSSFSTTSSTDSGADKFPGNFDRSVSVMPQSGPKKTPIGQKPRTLSLELDGRNKAPGLNQTQQSSASSSTSSSVDPIAPSRRRAGTSKSPLSSAAKIMVVWLESYEDHLNYPMDDMLQYSRTGEENQTGNLHRASDCHVIFLHALSSGLLRVKLQGPVGRMSFATPLVDGMVLSRRVVGSLVRQTVYNMAKRRRLDNDLYQPPHVRRRIKVQDLVQKYSVAMNEPELLAHLFRTVE